MKEGKPISLLVRNLRYTTSPDRVREFFERYEYYSKLPRGFGFVEFANEKDAHSALNDLNTPTYLDGAQISVTIAQQGRKSPDSMRHRERVSRGRSYRYAESDMKGDYGRRKKRYRSSSYCRRSYSYSPYRDAYRGSRSRSRRVRRHYSSRYRDRSYSRNKYEISPSVEVKRRYRRDHAYSKRYRCSSSNSNYRKDLSYRKSISQECYRRTNNQVKSERRSKSTVRMKSSREREFTTSPIPKNECYGRRYHTSNSTELNSSPVTIRQPSERDYSDRHSRSESESPERRIHHEEDDLDEVHPDKKSI